MVVLAFVGLILVGRTGNMLSRDEARALVVAEVSRPPKYPSPGAATDLVVVDEDTIEKDWGWVFFYTSQRYLETRNITEAIAGNPPYIVNRHTGEVRVTGTGQPTEHYIAQYEIELARR